MEEALFHKQTMTTEMAERRLSRLEYDECEYLFDEAEVILGDTWILASLLCTFLSSTAAGYIVYRFQDESLHLLDCNNMIKRKTNYYHRFLHFCFLCNVYMY